MKKHGTAAGRLVMLSALVLGIVQLLVVAPWMGEDEPWQFEYVHAVARGHLPLAPAPMWTAADLPSHPPGVLWGAHHLATLSRDEAQREQMDIVASMRAHHFAQRVDNDPRHAGARTYDEVMGESPHYNSFSQPRGYYLVAGALVALSGVSGVDAELFVARLFSLACYLAVVAFTLGLARLVAQDESIVFVAGLAAAWLPVHAFQSAVVSNDVLAKVAVAAVLYFAARYASGRGGVRDLVLAGICLAAGLFTKTTAAGGIAAIGLALFMRKGTSRRVRGAGIAGVVLLVAAALGYWLFTHNPALPKSFDRFVQMLGAGLQPKQFLRLWATLVGTTNWELRRLPDWAYLAVGSVGLAALCGALFGLVRPGRGYSRPLLLVCAVLAAAQLALLVMRGELVGRYWLPMLPAGAVLFAVGLLGLLPSAWRRTAALAALLFFVVYEGAFLWGAVVVNHYLVWGA